MRPMAENSERAAKRQRGPGRPFAKGASGNPGGRKPIPPDVKAILLAGDETAARRLVQLAQSDDEGIALKASVAILERNHGKPTQPVEGPEGAALSFQIIRTVAK